MKVGIIGAGLAGLASAQALLAKGHEVTIFEKSRGRGGRLARKKLDWGQMDIGAQYFTTRGDRFIAQCEHWQRAGVIAQWQFSPYKISDGQLLASPDDQVRWVGVPTMNALAHQLAEGLDIRLNTPVGAIAQGGRLQGEAGEDLGRYDFLVVAVPAEQAAQLLAEFDLAKAIPTQALVPCWAVGLLAAAKQAVDPAIQGIFGDNTVKWVSRDSAKPGRELTESGCDLWQLHMSPEWSTAHPKEAQPEVITEAAKWLEAA
jgi:predicted NAD/FAD-dependent oxidoreductase